MDRKKQDREKGFIGLRGPGGSLAAALGLVALLGCGGGGSSSSTPPSITPSNPDGWTGMVALEASLTMDSVAPAAAMDSAGDILAVWQKAPATGVTVPAETQDVVWGARYAATSSAWQGDQSFSAITGGNQDIKVAGDGKGDFMYAWDVTTNGTAFSVYAAGAGVAGAPGTPVLLGAGSSTPSPQPAIAMNAAGAAWVAWMVSGPSHLQVWAAQYDPATLAWSAPLQISTTTTTDALWPRVGMDSAGDAVIMWTEGSYASDGPFSGRLASFVPGTGWSAPTSPLAQGDISASAYALAMTDGGAQAAWSESADGGLTFVVRSARWTAAGGAWSTPVAVSAGGGMAILPAVALDSQGNGLLAWTEGSVNGYAPTAIFTATCTASGPWLTPQALVTGGLGIDNLVLAMNAGGSAVLAFNQFDGTTWRTLAANYAPATGMANPLYIQSSTGGDADLPAVCIDAAGQALVAWDQGDAANDFNHHIYGNRFN